MNNVKNIFLTLWAENVPTHSWWKLGGYMAPYFLPKEHLKPLSLGGGRFPPTPSPAGSWTICLLPYQCIHCEKMFSHNCNLCSHMQTHTGKKPCQCSRCEKVFSHKILLIAIWRLILGRRHINAPFVGKLFQIKGIIKSIWKLISGEKLFNAPTIRK